MDFTEGNISKQVIHFTTPLFLSNLLQVCYHLTDMIIVGQFFGKVGLSAVAVGGDVTNFMTFIAFGFANASQVIISQLLGAKEKDKIVSFIKTLFTFLTLCAFFLGAIGILFRHPILHIMNTPAESYQGALSYSIVTMSGLIFVYGYNICSAVMRGLGDSKHPFLTIGGAAILNIVLDLVFIGVFELGVFGAALATILSEVVNVALALYFLRKYLYSWDIDLFHGKFFAISLSELTLLLQIGIPMAIKNAAVSFSKLFVNSFINSYGIAVSAMAGIANKVNTISNLLSNCFNTAGACMIGQNIGAEQYKRVPKILKCIVSITLCVASCFSLFIIVFPNSFFGFFTSDSEVLRVSIEYIPIAVLVFFGAALRAPSNGLLNGSGNYRLNFLVAILDGIILRIAFSFFLGKTCHMDYLGFWLGDALTGFTPFFIAVPFFLSDRWKTNRYIIKKRKVL